MPELPETPEPLEVPEAPEAPETPEIPEVPELPEEPEEPAQPDEQDEPDNTLAQEIVAQDTALAESAQPTGPGEADTPVAPERRMPTLAVMAQLRRDPRDLPAAPKTQVAPTEANNTLNTVMATPEALGRSKEIPNAAGASSPAAGGAETAQRRVRLPSSPPATPTAAAPLTEPEANATDTVEDAQQQSSLITRPVTARYSNRRRNAGHTPGFVWENDPRLPYLPWPLHRHNYRPAQTLPPANVLVPVVVFQIFVMALLGLSGALIELNNDSTLASWTLAGAVIAGMGGAIAYAFSEIGTLKRFAPSVLVVSQLGLLVWAMAVFGSRASLLALTPALVEVTLLMSGALLASVFLLGALLIYALLAGLSVSIGMTPIAVLDPTATTVLDVLLVVVGLLAALWLLLVIQSGRERAQAIARARRHEADVLRNLVTQFRQDAQDDTSKLESALLQALKGHGIGPIPMEGMYRLLAETIMDTASRLEVLQRDREERLRLEGSLRVVIRAVERQWLGLEPGWPGLTGTAVDELVALLRTPPLDLTYQSDPQSPSITPRLIPIPTLAVEHDTPLPSPISRPLSGASWLSPSRRRMRRPSLYPLPSAGENLQNHETDDDESISLWNTPSYRPSQDDR